jgi:hypothetical protein
MGFSDRIADRLSRPAARVLDGPIRGIVHDLLKEAGYASPAEVDALREEARALKAQLERLDKKAAELAGMLEKGRAGKPDAKLAESEARRAEAEARVARVESQLAAERKKGDAALAEVRAEAQSARAEIERMAENRAATERALTARIAALEAGLGGKPTPPPAPVTAAQPEHCKVSGCREKVRSKGFCSPHYQQWRRGTLKGYVTTDGTFTLEGRDWSVSPKYAGGVVAKKGDRILVDGQPVEPRPVGAPA